MKKYILLVLFLMFPYTVFADELIPNSVSGYLIEASTGKVLYEKEIDKEVSIASMTKMVAQIIILDEIRKGNIRWTDIVTVSKNASDMGGSQIYIETGEKISVEDLMKGISVASGNDATVAMAEYISGSEEKFVERMNDVVKKLGLKHTHFINCTGLDEDGHYSSSYDMAMIAKELVNNYPEILRFSSIYDDYLREESNNKFWLVNTNKLINQYDGADGLKTGHTDAAGYCLAATAKRNDIRLIAIVLGEKDSKVRNKETMELLDYGFNNIKSKVLKQKSKFTKRILLDKATSKYIDAIIDNDLVVIEDINTKNKYNIDIVVDKINYPIKTGDIIGNVNAVVDSKIIASVNLISNIDVDRLSLFNLYFDNLKRLVIGIL